MYPHPVHVFGSELAVWNAAFLVAVAVGYIVLRSTPGLATGGDRPRLLGLRFLVTVYLAALSAQLFAYAFDLNTTLLPPPDVSAASYYLDPLSGPKTLYGAVLMLPAAMLIAAQPADRARYFRLLDAWTPAMLATLAVTRVGCFLQGCCYGCHSELFGVTFPQGSPVYWRQVGNGVIARDSPPLPVVPTQLLEAIVLGGLAVWAFRALRRGSSRVFADSVAVYSLARFVLEIFRDDAERNSLGPLSTSQWIAAAILVMYAAWRSTSRPSREPHLSPSQR